MDPDRAADVSLPLADLDRRHRIFNIRADRHDAIDAGLGRALHHRVELLEQSWVREVAMSVDHRK